jgi:CHASE2 domain-containing sensor protein
MSILLVLKLGQGDWRQGFPHVSVQLWETENAIPIQWAGTLPPDLELQQLYDHWRRLYEALSACSGSRSRQNSPGNEVIVFDEGDLLRFSDAELFRVCEQLKKRLNHWLNSEDFSHIEHRLRTDINPSESIRVIIETGNETLRRFPWHLWRFFEDYPLAEMALSPTEYRRVTSLAPKLTPQVRILAILGNSEGIEVQQDRALLEQLPDAEVVFLVQPERCELDRCLWDERGWDILFFAGHSSTQPEGEWGYLEINSQETLSIAQLKNALNRAINRGLKLAIFNSCDGLGLARQLASLHIPQIIVMREPVPDLVAQAFFKHFLTAFRNGQSFYLSVREARERLQGLEAEFPCASWLPVICQNPADLPQTWQQLQEKPEEKQKPPDARPQLRRIGLASLVVTGLIMGLRWLGVWQGWELKAFDTLMIQRPQEAPDSRLLIIGIDEEDIRRYGYPLPDSVLGKLLDQLNTYQPAVIGLDLFRDQPVPTGESPQASPLTSLFKETDNLVAICALSQTLSDSIAPPEAISPEQVGFANLYDDRQLTGTQDDTVRRYLLSRSTNPLATPSRCTTLYSFAWQLTYRYLQVQDLPVETVGDDWKFGSVVVQRLENRSGGYQKLDGRGNQVLINYRATPQIAQQLTLRDVLEGEDLFQPAWVKGRLVLIGMIATSVNDSHDTPYGEMRGIYIHAHVVSQLLSAVGTEKRPLLWWLPQWGEWIWIGLWSGVGGLTVWVFRSPLRRGMGLSLVLITLYGVCWLSLTHGGWLPLIPSTLVVITTAGIVVVTVGAEGDK